MEFHVQVCEGKKRLNTYATPMNEWAAMMPNWWKPGDATRSCSRNFRPLQIAELKTPILHISGLTLRARRQGDTADTNAPPAESVLLDTDDLGTDSQP